jgi:hypothetical protein
VTTGLSLSLSLSSSRHSIVISGENLTGTEKVLASVPAPLPPSANLKGPRHKLIDS